MLESKIIFLEMFAHPGGAVPPPRSDLAIVRACRPTVRFYKFLYKSIGEEWLWVDRLRISQEELLREITHPAVEVYVLYADGVPAGLTEIDFRIPEEAELKYFGIMPEFLGQKLGPHLLAWTIDLAWSRPIHRFWVHTCDRDHPAALPMYKKSGFVPYKEEWEIVPDPRLLNG